MVDGPREPETVEEASDEIKKGGEVWKQHTKAIERVISVALSLDHPKTAKAIAEEAQVAEQTARDHLGLLQNLSVMGSTTARGVTKYHPDAGYLRFRAVAGTVEEHTKDELFDMSRELKERDERIKEQYGAEGPDDLRSQALSDEVGAEEMAELKQAASEWETVRHHLSIIEQAHQYYDEHNGVGTSASA